MLGGRHISGADGYRQLPRSGSDLLAGFAELALSDDRVVQFYAVVPLYAEEMEFKLKNGTDALLERFATAGVDELIDPRRVTLGRVVPGKLKPPLQRVLREAGSAGRRQVEPVC